MQGETLVVPVTEKHRGNRRDQGQQAQSSSPAPRTRTYLPKKSILRKFGKLGIESNRQIPQGHVAPQKFGKERVQREASCISATLKNAIRVRQNLRVGRFTNPCNRKDAPADKRVIWRNMSTSSMTWDKATFFSPTDVSVMHPLRKRQRKENLWSTPEHQCRC